MKKLLAVLMVLSIATVANAGLTISGAPTAAILTGTSVTLKIVSDGLELDPLIRSEGIHLKTSDITLGTFDVSGAATPGAMDPSAANIGADDLADIFIDLAWSGNPIPVIPAGDAVTGLVFTCLAEGDVTIDIVGDSTGATYDTIVISQIPEPMTLGLLGLGGLFLRRRK